MSHQLETKRPDVHAASIDLAPLPEILSSRDRPYPDQGSKEDYASCPCRNLTHWDMIFKDYIVVQCHFYPPIRFTTDRHIEKKQLEDIVRPFLYLYWFCEQKKMYIEYLFINQLLFLLHQVDYSIVPQCQVPDL